MRRTDDVSLWPWPLTLKLVHTVARVMESATSCQFWWNYDYCLGMISLRSLAIFLLSSRSRSYSLSIYEFFIKGKFISKIIIFGDFWGRKPIFLKPQRWNLSWRCGPVSSSHTSNFIKIASWDIPLCGKCIPNITNFGDFFKSHNSDVWRWGADLGLPLPCQIL